MIASSPTAHPSSLRLKAPESRMGSGHDTLKKGLADEFECAQRAARYGLFLEAALLTCLG
jgi:hypothetical protein